MSHQLLFTLCGGGGGGGGGAALAVAVYAFNIHLRHHPQSSLNGETDWLKQENKKKGEKILERERGDEINTRKIEKVGFL